MRRIWLALLCCSVPALAQTATTYVGTIKDLTGATVTSGRITWTLQAPIGQIPGTGTFVASTVSCLINGSGAPVATDGASPCTVTNNTSLTPTGTSYQICIQANYVQPGSCFATYATGGTVDISTLVPTPTTQPNYGLPGVTGAPAWATAQVSSLAQLQSAITACGSSPCTIQVSLPVAISTNTTIPSNATLIVANSGQLQPSGGVTLTINGAIQAAPVKIFGGLGTIALGSLASNLPPVQWWGAVADSDNTGSTGTDNTAAIQACLNAIHTGQCYVPAGNYRITSALTISRDEVGLRGVDNGWATSGITAPSNPSRIVLHASTGDMLDVAGADSGHNILSNRIEYITLTRGVIPSTTGVNANFSLKYSYGAIIRSVSVEDAQYGFYFLGVGAGLSGYIENCDAYWGYNGLVETSGNLFGFYVDSKTSINSPSLRIRNSGSGSLIPITNVGVTTYGLRSDGTQPHDLHLTHFETALVNYGVVIDDLAPGGASAADIFLDNGINDGCFSTCVLIIGASGGTVNITNGWEGMEVGTPSQPVIDIQNSSHVVVAHEQLYCPACTAPLLRINTGGANIVSGVTFLSGSAGALSVIAGDQNVITGNTAVGPNNWGTSIFSFTTASIANVIANNTISGTATNGIFIDGTSTSQTGLETNNVLASGTTGTITNPLNDASHNGITPIPSGLTLQYAAGGGTQCLQADNNGKVTGTGSACGSGGGGGSLPSATDTNDTIQVNGSGTAALLTPATSGTWEAVQNGGADNTGSVDASSILQTKLNALCASSTPVRVHLTAGTYKINSGIAISATSTTCKNLVIEGDGPNTILQTTNFGIWYNNTTNSGEHFNGPIIRHLQIQCTAAATCSQGIRITQAAGFVLEDLLITGFAGQTSYATGTVSTSGATVTGVGTTFTAAMVHGFLETTSGTATTRAEICGYTSATSLTLCSTAYPTGALAGASYAIVYGGDGISLDPGFSYTQYGTIKDVYLPGNLIGIHAWGNNASGGVSRISVLGDRDYISPNPSTRIADAVAVYLGKKSDTFTIDAPANNVAACWVLESAHANRIRGKCEDNSTYAAVTTCNGGVAAQSCTQAAEVSSDANGNGWGNQFNVYAYLVGTVYRVDNSTGAFDMNIQGDQTLSGQYTTHYDWYGTAGCPANGSGIPALVTAYDCNHQLVTQTVN